jgi:hypothetical protein
MFHPDRLREPVLFPPPRSANGQPIISFHSLLSFVQLGPHHTRQAAQVHAEASTHWLSKRIRQARSLPYVNADCRTGECTAAEDCLVAVMTWHRVEDDADLHPYTTCTPAGFKFATTDSFGTMEMDEFSDRR